MKFKLYLKISVLLLLCSQIKKWFGSARGNKSYVGSYSHGILLDLLNKLLPGQYLEIFGGRGGRGMIGKGYGYGGSGQDSGMGGGMGGKGNGGSKGQGQNEIVITGPFNLEQGKPYFISATQNWDRWTWVGRVPERITFNLKPGANYIALPLDTRLKKAVDICDNLSLPNDATVGAWDVRKQEFLFGASLFERFY
ncbi:MAG: hypothetical protein ACPLXC_02000 [Candidatus Pacearchaeota archaeon]